MLHEEFPALVRQQRVRIVATDLSRTMIKRCDEGRYSQFEVNRGLPASLLLTYFNQDGRDWVFPTGSPGHGLIPTS
jgi:chemotaxis protein methyltransferase CheR